MLTPSSVETVVTDYAPQMAAQMRHLAEQSHSEKDARHGCNVLIENFLTQAGLTVTGRHEYGLKGGRIDSKYGDVILEYKDPKGGGRLGESLESSGTKKVVAQIQQRFHDFGTEAPDGGTLCPMPAQAGNCPIEAWGFSPVVQILPLGRTL